MKSPQVGEMMRSLASGAFVFALGAAMAALLFGGAARAADPIADHPVFNAGQYAETAWPDEFAGFWLEPGYPRSGPAGSQEGIAPDQKVYFAFTAGAEAKVAQLRSLFPATSPYVAVTHTYSMSELRRLQGKVAADLQAYMGGQLNIPGPAFQWYGVGIRPSENMVNVELSVVTPEYVSWAEGRYAPYGPAIGFYVDQQAKADVGLPGPFPKVDLPGEKAKDTKKARAKARTKAREKALRKKCRRAARVAVRTGSPKAKKIARAKKCRAVLKK